MTLLNILRLTHANCYVSEALQFELYVALIIMTNGALDFFTDLTKRTGKLAIASAWMNRRKLNYKIIKSLLTCH